MRKCEPVDVEHTMEPIGQQECVRLNVVLREFIRFLRLFVRAYEQTEEPNELP